MRISNMEIIRGRKAYDENWELGLNPPEKTRMKDDELELVKIFTRITGNNT